MIDSGSIVTIAKDQNFFDSITSLKHKVVMETNGGNANIECKGNGKGYGSAYYYLVVLTNIISVLDVIAKGFQVYFN